MDINYGEYGEFIHPDITNALKTRRHSLGDNNAYPVMDTPLHEGNFEQQCAKKRFNDVILKYQEATGNVGTEKFKFAEYVQANIMLHVFNGVMKSCKMEEPHRKQLEDLAVDIVRKDFNIGVGDVIFNVKIVGFGNVKFPDEMKSEKEDMMEPPEITEDNFEYDIDDEVQKRQFINALISGASKKGHYIFHLGKEELDAIDKKLIPTYQILMSANDIMYYLMGEQYIKGAVGGESNESHAGYEKLSFDKDGTPIITVEAINFPTLLHEIIKGVLELIATLALPDDKSMVDYIYDMADYVEAEMWYLRLGPVFWEKLISCVPPEYSQLKSQLLGKAFGLETDDFNSLMKSAMSKDNQEYAKTFFADWGRIIKENIRDYNQRNA